MTYRFTSIVALVGFALTSASAQEQWKWPEKGQNLQVLSGDMRGNRLAPVMRGFTRALGVRCSYCHVGEEGKDLLTYDFVSDHNPNKDRAREMLRMLGDINGHLKKIQISGDKAVTMGCQTCHRGRPRPMTLVEELSERYKLNGVEVAVAHYRDLKKRFYGRGAYDFGEQSLNELGYQLLGNNDAQSAIRIFTLNIEEYPNSPNVWDSLAEAYLKFGDKKKARKYYEKVLSLDPTSENAKAQVKTIKES